jgi:hypothetical protein
MGISTITMRDSAGRDRALPITLRGEGRRDATECAVAGSD